MNLDKIVVTGRRPWNPNPDVTDLSVWDADDAPTLGTFRVDGTTVLFLAVEGVERARGTWIYVPLTTDEVEAFDADGAMPDDELNARVEGLFDGREVVVTDAKDLEISEHWVRLDSSGGPLETTLSYLKIISKVLRAEVADLEQMAARYLVEHADEVESAYVEREDVEHRIEGVKRLVSAH